MKNTNTSPRGLLRSKSNRGFSLTEIICAIIVMGIMAAVGATYMKNSAQAAMLNAGNQNAASLNNTLNLLASSGATIQVTSDVITQGTATTPGTVGILDAAGGTAYITQIQGTGVTSFNVTATMKNAITAASYTVSVASGFPVFSYTVGATP